MNSAYAPRKGKETYRQQASFSSSFELLTARLPVENMSSILPSTRYAGPQAMGGLSLHLAYIAPAPKVLVVADDNTWAAARAMVEPQLSINSQFTLKSLGTRVRAEKIMAEAIAGEASGFDVILAVGSGTINDICKYAAFIANTPYLVVATAASMNGYTASGASLLVDGFKQSFAARPPLAVVADSAILLGAPKRLTRAGIGDTLCRTTVEADMLLSHLLLDSPYPREMFDCFRAHEEPLLAGLMRVQDGEAAYIERLITALLDAGDAMATSGSSAVASQGEHMIAHTLELKYGSELFNVMHGELIAVTSVTMSQFQQRMLNGVPLVRRMEYSAEQFVRLFGKRHADALAGAYNEKLLSDARVASINARIQAHWPDMLAQLQEVILPTMTLERAFIHSGLNTKPAQINMAEERYRFATSYAHLTRNRFTFLDLAAMNVRRVA